MRRLAGIICLAVMLLPLSLAAQSSTCPADRAGEQGYDPFAAFHEIMAPAWHVAWAEKDYAALLAAGPKFVDAFAPISALKPEFKTFARKAAYARARNQFSHLVKQYSEASIKNDSMRVYELMPELHDAFEQTASVLLPVHYPEFDGMVLTVNMILETHLPKDNRPGVIGSTETLITKLEALTPETLPEELKESEEPIMDDIMNMRVIAAKMKACCENDDMKGYKEHITALDEAIHKFIDTYI